MPELIRKLFLLLTRRERWGFIAVTGIMLLEAILEIISLSLVPVYISLIAYPDKVAEYLPQVWKQYSQGQILFWGSVLVVVFFVAKLVINTAASYLKIRYSHNRALRFSSRLYAVYMRAPYTYHLQRNSADLLRNLSINSTQLADLVLIPMMELFSQGLIIIAVVGALLFYIPLQALLILLLALAIAAFIVMREQRKIRVAGKQAQLYRGKVVQDINEGLGCAKELKLLGRVQFFLDRFNEHFTRLMQHLRYAQVMNKFIPNWVEVATIAGLVGVVLYLLQSGWDSDQVLQVATVCAVGLARLKGALSQFMTNYSRVQHNRASLEVVSTDLQGLKSELPANPENHAASYRFQNTLRLQNVSFRYPDTDTDVLSGIDLTIHKGEAIGFIGKTGAGKSTLIDLVLGLLEPTGGRILLDGQLLRDNLPAWQADIGYVPQMIALVDGTIRDNIALGIEPDRVNEAALRRAVEQAQLQEMLERLPQGLNTVIGEQGIRLSGGQRQRVAIARALYHDPDVLVLDEGTSALDHETEKEVIKAVEGLKGSRTILMIAHRLSTLKNCDRIIRLENGRIAEQNQPAV